MSISVMSLLVNCYFVFEKKDLFWRNNVHLMMIIGGLTLFYGFFLRIMYGMTFKQGNWNKAIIVVILGSLVVGLLTSMFGLGLDMLYVDKMVYREKWTQVISI